MTWTEHVARVVCKRRANKFGPEICTQKIF